MKEEIRKKEGSKKKKCTRVGMIVKIKDQNKEKF